MKVDERIIKRFDELIEKGDDVYDTFQYGQRNVTRTRRSMDSAWYKDTLLCAEWTTSCLVLLETVFTKDHEIYSGFKAATLPVIGTGVNNDDVLRAMGLLKAAKDIYENGYLFSIRNIVEAEIFDDLLEQAEHLGKEGYFIAAAVLAGCTLEDALRKLCLRTPKITLPAEPKMNWMNDQLAKEGVYNSLIQKKVGVLANLRNDAAHGKWKDLDGREKQQMKDEVKKMILEVRSFLENHL